MDNQQVLRQQLIALLEGGHAHEGPTEIVADIPAKLMNTHPPKLSYSPWQLLEHMRITQWDILEFIRDPAHISPEWPKGYWPPKEEQVDEARWQDSLNGFLQDLNALKDIVSNPQTDLVAPIPHAQNYTVLREILTAADHNAYHLGEFGIMKTILGV